MAADETALARRYRLEIDLGTTTPAWTLVPGIQEFTPKVDPTQQDSTDYESGGWKRNTTTALQWSVEATLLHRYDPESKLFSPAQEALKTAAKKFGAESKVHVRYYDRDGLPDAHEGYALVTWEPDGGSDEDLESISLTLTGDGELLDIATPVTGGGA
ncbi:phage tail tube protein [Streptomyces sp. NPDC001937]